MAVQKNKKSRAKKGMRRAHDFLTPVQLSEDKTTGELHFRHHVTKDGYYKGEKVIFIKSQIENDDKTIAQEESV